MFKYRIKPKSFPGSFGAAFFRPVKGFVHGHLFASDGVDELEGLLLGHNVFGRLNDLGHILFDFDLDVFLLLQKCGLHLLPLLANLLILLQDSVLTLNVHISLSQFSNRSEFLMVILFVEVHAVGEHSLDVAYFHRNVG